MLKRWRSYLLLFMLSVLTVFLFYFLTGAYWGNLEGEVVAVDIERGIVEVDITDWQAGNRSGQTDGAIRLYRALIEEQTVIRAEHGPLFGLEDIRAGDRVRMVGPRRLTLEGKVKEVILLDKMKE
jgi:hypothetical protein